MYNKLLNIYTGGNSIYTSIIKYYKKGELDFSEVFSEEGLKTVELSPFISSKRVIVIYIETMDILWATIKFVKKHYNPNVRRFILVSYNYLYYSKIKEELRHSKSYIGSYPNEKVFKLHVNTGGFKMSDRDLKRLRSLLYKNFGKADMILELIKSKDITVNDLGKILKKPVISIYKFSDSLLQGEEIPEKELFKFLAQYKYAYNYISEFMVKRIDVILEYYEDYLSGSLVRYNLKDYEDKERDIENILSIIEKRTLGILLEMQDNFSDISSSINLLECVLKWKVN